MANVTYTVKKGDTLTGIASAKNTTVNAILALNPDITNRNLIYVGQVIIISGTAASKTKNNSQKAKITNFGLQSNTDRTIFATWSWDKSNTKEYEVKWTYATGDGVAFVGNKSTTTNKQSVYNAPENATQVAFYVRPISKTYKTKNQKEVKYWTADWSTVKRYYFIDAPVTPPIPKFTGDPNAILSLKDFKLTITLNNLALNADKIEFEITKVGGAKFKTGSATITNKKASYSCTLAAGEQYTVRSRSVKGSLKSEWSDPSEYIIAMPAASEGIYLIYALNSTTVQVNWYDVSGVDSYEVQYTATKRFFDSNSSGVWSQTSEVGYAQISNNIVWGNTYFFRVRSIKSDKKSAWSEIKSITLAGAPAAPTTWSSQSTSKVGDPLTLYWVHNSQDGSRQTRSQLQLTVDGFTETITTFFGNCVSTDNQSTKVVSTLNFSSSDLKEGAILKAYMLYVNTGSNIKLNVNDLGAIDVVAADTLNSLYWAAGSIVTFKYSNDTWVVTDISVSGSTEAYSVDTSQYTEGTSIRWKVRTAGIAMDTDGKYIYSDWSTERTIDVYAPPTVQVNVTDHAGDLIDELTVFPFNLAILSGPNTQTPIGYSISITANEAYEDIDEAGNTIYVGEGSEVYYKRIDDTSRALTVPITASDINLKNNIGYKVTVTVGMNSGLSGESSAEFSVALEDAEYWPDAEITYDEESFTTSIRPYCQSENGVLIDGVILSVYRREFDGSFTELATGINNTERTYITDPHPSLDYARYRVVATDSSSGAISYYDVPGYPINETSVIIQWDEKWQNFDLTDDKFYELNGVTYADELEQPSWSGSLVKLPYNIDVSDDHQPDVSLVKYIGRKHPVSYYGTQLGSTSTWTMEIPKEDKQTLYAIRRLAIWSGDVYVREPSGSGYWASINISFDQTHNELTIPITINITRVEGGK